MGERDLRCSVARPADYRARFGPNSAKCIDRASTVSAVSAAVRSGMAATCRNFIRLCLAGPLLLAGLSAATDSPTPSPTIWWANEFLFFTYFELYFIGTGILLGSFLLCFCCCALTFREKHPITLTIEFFENMQKARAKRVDERFKESSSLLGKGPRSNA